MNGLVTTLARSAAGLAGLTAAFGPAEAGLMSADAPPRFQPTDYHYRSANARTQIEVVSRPLVGDPVVDSYRPRTELGRKLIELRRAYILGGGKLLSWEELDAEMRNRRGGVADA